MCTSRDAVIEENGHASDIGIRQEGRSLDGNVELPHICVKRVHWLFLKIVYTLGYYSQNKCKVWSNGGIMEMQHTPKPRDIQRLMLETLAVYKIPCWLP